MGICILSREVPSRERQTRPPKVSVGHGEWEKKWKENRMNIPLWLLLKDIFPSPSLHVSYTAQVPRQLEEEGTALLFFNSFLVKWIAVELWMKQFFNYSQPLVHPFYFALFLAFIYMCKRNEKTHFIHAKSENSNKASRSREGSIAHKQALNTHPVLFKFTLHSSSLFLRCLLHKFFAAFIHGSKRE